MEDNDEDGDGYKDKDKDKEKGKEIKKEKETMLTDDVDECEEFTEEVSVGPPVVVLQVVREVIQQQPLLLPLLNVLPCSV